MVSFRQKSWLSKVKQEELIKYFVADSIARAAAVLVGTNRHTATLYFHKLREVIAWYLEQKNSDLMSSKIELDESYFGGHRKEKEVEARREQFLSLGFWNGQARFMLFPYPMPAHQHLCLS